MKVLKCILVASLCMALSIPALAQSPVINDESGPQATPISEEERFSINPRGWYSFDASVRPSGTDTSTRFSFTSDAGYARIECNTFDGTSGNKVYFRIVDQAGNSLTEAPWINAAYTFDLDYLNNVTGSYSNARLKITGGSNNSGTTRVKGYCCPD